MREAGVSPDAATYNSLIAGATRIGLPVRALDLFDEMLRSGIAPDGWRYNIFIHCLFPSGYPEDAYRVFADMAKKGVEPCATTYNTLLDLAVQGWPRDEGI
jgi:pentatricopeptide repeat protein